jgi:hypothetical protein
MVVVATASSDLYEDICNAVIADPDKIINPTYTIWAYPIHEVEKNIFDEARLHTLSVLLVEGEFYDSWEVIELCGRKFTKVALSYAFPGASADKFFKKFAAQLKESKVAVFGEIGN